MSGTLSIPASDIVAVTPSVISAGGSGLDLSGMFLTQNVRVPIGTPLAFSSEADVSTFFGATALETTLAVNYFLGFDNSSVKPAQMWFTQYNSAAVGAWTRGGTVSGMTLAQLQALTGSFNVTIDGTAHNVASINLATATGFQTAAELISTAIGITGPPGASFTGAIAATTLTVSAVASGTLAVGQEVKGVGITANTLITALGTGTGTTGTYTVSPSQTVSSEAMTTDTPVVTYDTVAQAFQVNSPTTGVNSSVTFVSGTLADPLNLRQADGAIQSLGAAPSTPSGFMDSLSNFTQDWASFSTIFDPDNGSGNANKQLFAAWVNGKNDRYVYMAWDTDASPTTSSQATSSLGFLLKQSNSSGTVPIYSPNNGPELAAFLAGAIASVNFTQHNGRATMMFRGQTGITPDIVNQSIANNLRANEYNFYGVWGTANDKFNFLADGTISGPFQWIDSYINQIWMNNQFQLALMELLVNAFSIPYNQTGYGMIKAACQDVINQAVDFGAVRAGVTLSQAQIAEVNNQAGVKIDDVLSTRGWYLQVRDATPQVRQARKSPPITFWYMDGQSVQRINLNSVELQ